MKVTDAETEAAWYAAFLGWKVRSNDANGIYMDIGDWGGVIQGRLHAAAARARRRWWWCWPRRGAGRHGGRARRCGSWWRRRWRWWPAGRPESHGGVRCARPSRVAGAGRCGTASAGASRSGTRKRSRPRSRTRTQSGRGSQWKNFYSFHVKDPDGMDVQISNGTKKNRRQGPANGKLNVERRSSRWD